MLTRDWSVFPEQLILRINEKCAEPRRVVANLEVLLAPDKCKSVFKVSAHSHTSGDYRINLPRFTVLITVNVQRATETLGSTEEDTSLSRRV